MIYKNVQYDVLEAISTENIMYFGYRCKHLQIYGPIAFNRKIDAVKRARHFIDKYKNGELDLSEFLSAKWLLPNEKWFGK